MNSQRILELGQGGVVVFQGRVLIGYFLHRLLWESCGNHGLFHLRGTKVEHFVSEHVDLPKPTEDSSGCRSELLMEHSASWTSLGVRRKLDTD